MDARFMVNQLGHILVIELSSVANANPLTSSQSVGRELVNQLYLRRIATEHVINGQLKSICQFCTADSLLFKQPLYLHCERCEGYPLVRQSQGMSTAPLTEAVIEDVVTDAKTVVCVLAHELHSRQLSVETKIDLAPLMEEMQGAMGMGRRPHR